MRSGSCDNANRSRPSTIIKQQGNYPASQRAMSSEWSLSNLVKSLVPKPKWQQGWTRGPTPLKQKMERSTVETGTILGTSPNRQPSQSSQSNLQARAGLPAQAENPWRKLKAVQYPNSHLCLHWPTHPTEARGRSASEGARNTLSTISVISWLILFSLLLSADDSKFC